MTTPTTRPTAASEADRLGMLDEALDLARDYLVRKERMAILGPLAKVGGMPPHEAVEQIGKVITNLEGIRMRHIARGIVAGDQDVLAKVSAHEREQIGLVVAKLTLTGDLAKLVGAGDLRKLVGADDLRGRAGADPRTH